MSAPPRAELLVTGAGVRLARDFIGISSVVLVEAGGRRILVDTGGPASRGSLRQALADRAIAPRAIDVVLLTHLHFDHAWNIDLFPAAEIWVSRAELAYAAAPHPDDAFVPAGILERLARRRVRVLGEGAERPGGGLEILPAPGHTPGQVALAFEGVLTDAIAEDGGPAARPVTHRGRIVLAGDAIKTVRELATGRADLEFDPAARAGETMARLAEGADAIVPGHAPVLLPGPGGWAVSRAVALPLVMR